MKYFLRYMSDPRFKEILHKELELSGEDIDDAALEQSELLIPAEVKYTILNSALQKYFGEMSNTARTLLFEKLKKTVTDMVQEHINGPPYIKYPVYLSETLYYTYSYLSNLFSQMNGSTLEHYIIAQRIEVVKNMLIRRGFGLSEIAWRLGYCNISHLSNQFKKVTGITPTSYKAMAQRNSTRPGSHGTLGNMRSTY